MSACEGNFSNLTPAEFEEMITNALSPDFHDLSEEDFFTALAAIEKDTDKHPLRSEQPKRKAKRKTDK